MKFRDIDNRLRKFINIQMAKVITKVKEDTSLAFCFRENCVQIYYKGISILKIENKNKEWNYEISSGIFHSSFNYLKKLNSKKYNSDLEEKFYQMVKIREKLSEFGWQLSWKLTPNNKIYDMQIFREFLRKYDRTSCVFVGCEIDEWIKLVWDQYKNDADTRKKMSMTFKLKYSDNKIEPMQVLDDWLENIDLIKKAVDIYFFTTRISGEKILQNYLFRNMDIEGLVPIDLEYNSPSNLKLETKGRADIIAIDNKNNLSLMELKFNVGSLGKENSNSEKKESGVISHAKDFISLVSKDNETQLKRVIEDTKTISNLRTEFKINPYLKNQIISFESINYIMIFGYERNLSKSQLEKIYNFKELFIRELNHLPKNIYINNKNCKIDKKVFLLEVSELNKNFDIEDLKII